jgi:hypothetical protein
LNLPNDNKYKTTVDFSLFIFIRIDYINLPKLCMLLLFF